MLEDGLSEQQWDLIVEQALQFSANVCNSIHNSIDQAFADKKHREFKDYQASLEA